jgi:hypothetical protein
VTITIGKKSNGKQTQAFTGKESDRYRRRPRGDGEDGRKPGIVRSLCRKSFCARSNKDPITLIPPGSRLPPEVLSTIWTFLMGRSHTRSISKQITGTPVCVFLWETGAV